MLNRKALLAVAVFLVVILSVAAIATQAHGWCYSGVRYGGAGTEHNYVEFKVNVSARSWHIHREWWAFFPADLWAFPDGNGIARAGIRGTDWNPPYSPSGYKLCTG